jgi:hypothetical protein
MQIIQACHIDYAADVRGHSFEKGSNLNAQELSALHHLAGTEQITIEPLSGEAPYNAVLSDGTWRYLAQLDPAPSL